LVTLIGGEFDCGRAMSQMNNEQNIEATETRRSPAIQGQPINPALKSWMDNVLVPALVQQYLAAHARGTETGEPDQE
jgi:hypothetical protein